jgi:tetratricopeptide (TPR) repeat protein
MLIRNALIFLFTAGLMSVSAQSDVRQKAISLEQQGRNAESESAWLAVSAQRPSDPEPWAHLGLLEARQERYDQAIRYYHKAMAIAPKMAGLRLNLGLAYFKNSQYRPAIEMFGPLIQASPEDQRLLIVTGMSHYGLGEFGAATPYLRKAAGVDTQNLTLQLTTAHSCLYSNQNQCVLDCFHRIIALNSESAEAYMLVGEALDEMKDREGAIREFKAAVAANPKEPNVHFGLGYLLWTNGEHAAAESEFEAELVNDPTNTQANLYLADSRIQLNKFDDARPLLEKIVLSSPKNAMGHRDLGIVYAEQDRKEDAVRELQTALRIAPADVNAHWRLGRLYRSMGRVDDAKSEFEASKQLNKAEDDRLLKVMSKIPTKAPSGKELPTSVK